jgi:hypothetical protein
VKRSNYDFADVIFNSFKIKLKEIGTLSIKRRGVLFFAKKNAQAIPPGPPPTII